jgi:amphi-Trp domain-containing protein
MADTTSASQSLSREEVAGELEALANELRRGDEEIDVTAGNKSVSLIPAEPLEYDIEMTEREPMLGDKRESISIDLNWKTDGEE